METRTGLPVLVLSLLGMLTVCCGSDDGSSMDESEIDNCALLTAAEVAPLLGAPAKSVDGVLGCGYIPEGSNIAHLIIKSRAADLSPRELLEASFFGGEVKDLEGLGDEAVYRILEGNVANLAVRKGRVVISMVTAPIDLPEGSPKFNALVELADLALSRL